MDFYTVYIEGGIIVELTISQSKWVNSEFGSAVNKKISLTYFLNPCRSLFFHSLSLEDP